jgi:tRNA_anti-like
MTAKTKKIVLRTLLALVIIGAGAGFYIWKYVYNKPHQNVAEAKAIKVAATELYTAFVKDSASANKTYTGKVLEISGEVVKSELDQQQNVFVHLKAGEDGSIINCSMEEKVAPFKAGDKISLKGVCDGYNPGDTDMGLPGDVVVNRGYTIK